jgi:phage nucleotide-binding protein
VTVSVGTAVGSGVLVADGGIGDALGSVLATIVGEGGMGKTTLASLWPSPIFIPIEDGSASLAGKENVAMFPRPEVVTTEWVFDCLSKLASGGHNFKTVVLDSVTQLSTIIEAEIIAADPKAKSINQAMGGYGAGYSAMSRVHSKIRELAGVLKSKGMHVVFLAHAMSEKCNPPDQPEYLKYTIRMHKDSVAHYSDNVDLVGFIKLKTFVSEDKRATTSGQRIITCYPNPAHISKNRYGISRDLDFIDGTNPFQVIL